MRAVLRGRQWSFKELVLIDVLIALVLAWIPLLTLNTRHAAYVVPVWVMIVLGYGAYGAVLIRRRWPLTALIVAIVLALALIWVRGYALTFVATSLTLYNVAKVKSTRTTAAGFAALLCGLLPVMVFPSYPSRLNGWPFAEEFMLIAAFHLAAWMAGTAIRREHDHQQSLIQQTRLHDQARLAQLVAEERLRIARELHDVLGHNVSVIAVQAGVGHHLSETQPDEAARSLAVIEATSRATLEELGNLVGALRDEEADIAPVPALASLSILFEQTRHAGVTVASTITGTPRELPASLDMTAFRIVQEALTNVIKHAKTDHACVLIDYGREELKIEITDDGTGPCGVTSDSTGHGLIGIRERAAIHGGRFSAGARSPHGYRVSVWLPAGGPAQATA